jgi:hypothetical protein
MDFKAEQLEAVSDWFVKDDARIKIKVPGDSDVKAAREKAVKVWYEFHPNPAKGNALERVECRDLDQQDFLLAIANEVILDWEGITFDGKDLECTDENKNLLMTQSPPFQKWLSECADALAKSVQERFGSDDPSKNSKSM